MKVIHTKEGVSRFNLPTILEINSVMVLNYPYLY